MSMQDLYHPELQPTARIMADRVDPEFKIAFADPRRENCAEYLPPEATPSLSANNYRAAGDLASTTTHNALTGNTFRFTSPPDS